MAVQDTSRVAGMSRLDETPSGAKVARRLPVQKDWPAWGIIATQIGILIGIIGLWVAAGLTLITGWDYARAAVGPIRKADAPAPVQPPAARARTQP